MFTFINPEELYIDSDDKNRNRLAKYNNGVIQEYVLLNKNP